jgi:HK97 family phage major capsid protein
LLPQLASLATIVGTGGSESKLWQWATASDDYDLLAGFPAIQSEYCQVPGTPGDIIMCDFSRYVVTIRELRSDVSIHVKFLTDQQAFRFLMRVGGQPIDIRPVTPLNGTQQTSTFVALAGR